MSNSIGCVISHEVIIFDKAYKLSDTVSEGTNSRVYSFSEKAEIQMGKSMLSTSDLVLKVVHPLMNPRKIQPAREAQKLAYEYLRANQIPVPKLYLADEKNGWILEKMTHQIASSKWKNCTSLVTLDKTSLKILSFARSVLTKSAQNIQEHKREYINDFLPRNVMLDHKGQPRVIDFSLPQKSKHNLFYYLKSWSEGNETIFEFLTEAFPVAVKEQMQDRWKQVIAPQTIDQTSQNPLALNTSSVKYHPE